MTTKETKPVKQLRELLQEQQEPFTPDIYLVEKRCLRKSLNSEGSFSCCHGNSRKSIRGSSGSGLKKGEKGSKKCCQVFKAVYNQIISINKRVQIKSLNHGRGKSNVIEGESESNQEVKELERFSSASSTTVFNSCSEDDDAEETSTSPGKDHILITESTSQSFEFRNSIENELLTEQAATSRNMRWKYVEDSRQLSPVSVLENLLFHEDNVEKPYIGEDQNTAKCVNITKKVTEDSILLASLWKILCHSTTQKPFGPGVPEKQELFQAKTISQYLKSKKVLQQTKQLLFDCVKEVVEIQGRKQQQHDKEYLETEELGKLIGEKIKSWGRQSVNESNSTKMLEIDFQESAQEWKHCAKQRRDVVAEVGDTILEEIKNEIVMDMIDLL